MHVNPEFECKFDVQNSYFGGGYVFRSSFYNPKEFFHNSAYSVKLPYIADHSL